MNTLRVLLPLIAAAMLPSVSIAAERYPTRPVRMIVPYAPGGGSDITARAIGQKVGESLGQTFVVDSRPGASGMIGTELAARSTPDGYTLILADAAHTINSVAYSKPRYHAVNDFAPVALVAETPLALMAHPGFALNSVRDLLAMPRAQAAKLAMGTSGQGGGPQMAFEWLRTLTGFTLNMIPYKGGAPAMTDAMAGQIPLVFTSMAAGVPFLKSGRLKAIGITAAKRHPLLPDTQTFVEAGLKDFVVTHWYGILGPAGMPPDIIALLNRETGKALEAAEVRERFVTLALDITQTSPAEFRRMLEQDMARWRDVVVKANVRLD